MATRTEVNMEPAELQRRIERFRSVRDRILAQVRTAIVGQDEVLDQILIGLFVGRWIDRQVGGGSFWAGDLLMLGLAIGGWLRWRRMTDR